MMSLWGYQLFQIEISMCVCVCICVCVCVCVWVGGSLVGWVGQGVKSLKTKKTLESIEINQFCFKIYDLWKNFHLCGLKVVGHLGVVGCLGDSLCVCVCVSVSVCVCVCVTLIHSIKYNWGYLQPPVLLSAIFKWSVSDRLPYKHALNNPKPYCNSTQLPTRP